ncbi:MAG: hypothetical protein Q8Q49_02705 [bacterium]|nr:hypothetical protein [bacterium]
MSDSTTHTIFADGVQTGPMIPPTANYEGIAPTVSLQESQNRMAEALRYTYHDLDDSHHDAENFHFLNSWRHILRPWGYEWKPNMPDSLITPKERERLQLEPITDGTNDTVNLEPGIGKATLDVCKHFVTALGLSLDYVNAERFASYGPKRVEELIALRERAGTLSQEELLSQFASILDNERVIFTEDFIKREGVIALEGSPESISNLHEAGIATVIVTNAREVNARQVVRALGYRTYKQVTVIVNGEEEIREHVDRSRVRLIMSANKVGKRKPDPESLQLSDATMGWYALQEHRRDVFKGIKTKLTEDKDARINQNGELTQDDKQALLAKFKNEVGNATGWEKGLGMWGDSGSDSGAGFAHGVPVVIRATTPEAVQKFTQQGVDFVVSRFDKVTPQNLYAINETRAVSTLDSAFVPVGIQRIQPEASMQMPSLRER